MDSVLHLALGPRPATVAEADTIAAFRALWRSRCAGVAAPLDRAIVAGLLADRLAWAFLAGYECALRRLFPWLADDVAPSLCITETGPPHPNTILTRLDKDGDGWRLTGRKHWATLAGEANVLFVAARAGEENGHVDLRIVRVDPTAEGVCLDEMPPTPFVPEIPHFSVSLDRVRVSTEDIVADDAWARVIRPFRALEDLHVAAASLGCLLRLSAQAGALPAVRCEQAAVVTTLRALAEQPLDTPEAVVALEGALLHLAQLRSPTQPWWSAVPEARRERWQRDAALFQVASRARQQRLELALAALGHPET